MKELDDIVRQRAQLPQRLRLARKAAGITQDNVARYLDCSRRFIAAIEEGKIDLMPHDLVELAPAYRVSISELLRPVPVSPAFGVRFRTSPFADVNAPENQTAIAKLQGFADDYIYLEQLVNAPLTKHYPPEEQLKELPAKQAGENLALQERNRLDLGDSIVSDFRSLLECDVGIRVFSMDLPSSVSGLFVYSDIHGGCIAFNKAHPASRQRWTLAHEYAHFLAHRHQPELTGTGRYQRPPAHERLAESFAMNFLMPEAALKGKFHSVDMERSSDLTRADFLSLADRFQVSFEAMGRRLESIGMLRPYAVERLVAYADRVAEARNIVNRPTIDSDKQLFSDRYYRLALEAWSNEYLSEGQLSRLLRMDRTKARQLTLAYRDSASKFVDDYSQLLTPDFGQVDLAQNTAESSPCDLD